MFISAGKMETFAFAKSIGVGLVESAINLTRMVLQHNPNILIFVGSAGSYDNSIPLFTILESNASSQIELSFWQNQCYTPLENVLIAGETLQGCIVNSSNYISTESALCGAFVEQNILLENMEFFSVLNVAKSFQIPAFGIFCVTNYANKEAHNDFLQNFQKSNQLLEDYSKKYMQNG